MGARSARRLSVLVAIVSCTVSAYGCVQQNITDCATAHTILSAAAQQAADSIAECNAYNTYVTCIGHAACCAHAQAALHHHHTKLNPVCAGDNALQQCEDSAVTQLTHTLAPQTPQTPTPAPQEDNCFQNAKMCAMAHGIQSAHAQAAGDGAATCQAYNTWVACIQNVDCCSVVQEALNHHASALDTYCTGANALHTCSSTAATPSATPAPHHSTVSRGCIQPATDCAIAHGVQSAAAMQAGNWLGMCRAYNVWVLCIEHVGCCSSVEDALTHHLNVLDEMCTGQHALRTCTDISTTSGAPTPAPPHRGDGCQKTATDCAIAHGIQSAAAQMAGDSNATCDSYNAWVTCIEHGNCCSSVTEALEHHSRHLNRNCTGEHVLHTCDEPPKAISLRPLSVEGEDSPDKGCAQSSTDCADTWSGQAAAAKGNNTATCEAYSTFVACIKDAGCCSEAKGTLDQQAEALSDTCTGPYAPPPCLEETTAAPADTASGRVVASAHGRALGPLVASAVVMRALAPALL